jgi:hypothetical protein
VVTLAWTDAALTARPPGVDVEPRFPAREGGAVAFCRRPVLDRSTWTGLAYLCRRVALAPVALAVPAVGASLATGLPAAPLADGEHRRVDYSSVWTFLLGRIRQPPSS